MRPFVLLLVLSACAAPGRTEVDPGAGSPAGLGSTLDVRVVGDTVRLALHMTNVTAVPMTLEYATAQRYDFEIAREDGERVWRWSAEQVFAQVVGTEVLLAGESRRYEAVWLARDTGGAYVATGRLTSRNYPVELRTAFQVPAR